MGGGAVGFQHPSFTTAHITEEERIWLPAAVGKKKRKLMGASSHLEALGEFERWILVRKVPNSPTMIMYIK